MKRAFQLITTAGVMAVLASVSASAADDMLRARGNEPSWKLELAQRSVLFEAPGQNLRFEADSYERGMVEGQPRITARAGGATLEVTVTERLCADTMSGMPFPVGVEVALDGKRFVGCGGEIMTAIEGGWRVIRLGNDLPPEGVTLTVVFDRDGRVSGRSGCNRFAGGYTLSGEGLGFGPLASTRMACPPPRMEAERRMLDLLKQVTRVTPGENAQLRLMAGDEQAMVLDRAD